MDVIADYGWMLLILILGNYPWAKQITLVIDNILILFLLGVVRIIRWLMSSSGNFSISRGRAW